MDVYYISQNSRAARKYSRQVIIFVGRNLVCMLFFFHSKNLEKLEGRYNYKMHEQSPCFESRGCDSGFGWRCWILIGWSQRLTNITIPYATSGTSFNSQILRFFLIINCNSLLNTNLMYYFLCFILYPTNSSMPYVWF